MASIQLLHVAGLGGAGDRMRIGIDVGGTNTDAVLMDGPRVVSWYKTPTTPDVSSGIISPRIAGDRGVAADG